MKLHHKPYELCWFFLLGAFTYSLLEIVCRGYTHWTMTLTGGAAAVGLYLIRAAAPPKTRLLQCLCGALLITALEFTVGVADNLVMGWNVWDYSDMPFNINGRICLLYSIFWGFLGMLWIKNLYPRLAAIILKIPDKIGKIVTWVMVVFLVFDAAVSLIAVERWVQRREGIPANNGFLEFIDERFDDDRMKKIYANMVFGDEKDTEKEEGKGILSEILE